MVSPSALRNLKLTVGGALSGLAYGLFIRFGSRVVSLRAFDVMTLGFLVFLPFAIGFVTIFVIERSAAQDAWLWFLLPWVPVLAGELAMAALFLEGWICIVMFTPIALVASTLGGVAAGLIVHFRRLRRSQNATLVSVLWLAVAG